METGQIFDAVDDFRNLVISVTKQSKDGPPGSGPVPSKAYKGIRAFLRNAQTLRLFLDKTLGVPVGCCSAEIPNLWGNLFTLHTLLGCAEFAKLLKEAELLQRLQPLMRHTVEWLEGEGFAKKGVHEWLIIDLVLHIYLNIGRTTDVQGASAAERLRAHLPWKRSLPGLDEERVIAVTRILDAASTIITMSAFTSPESVTEDFAATDALGWTQGVLLWAAAAKGTDPDARKRLEALVSDHFRQLKMYLQSFSTVPQLLPKEVPKLARARALAHKLVADARRKRVDVSHAQAFLECLRNAETLLAREQSPTSRPLLKAETGAADHVAHVGLLKGWEAMKGRTSAEGLVDTRDPADVIGADGDFLGTWDGGERSEEAFDWEQVLREIQSGDEDTVRAWLPRLARWCAKAEAATREGIPRALAESLMQLLESGECSGLLQEPGALGTLFLILHVAVCSHKSWAIGSEDEERENFHKAFGARLTAWARPRVDRLCLQALIMATGLLRSVFNVTWAVKEFAVIEAGYLEYGFSLFELLESLAPSQSYGANASAWSAATAYMAQMLIRPPSQEHKLPPLESLQRSKLLEIAAVEKGILDWAVHHSKGVRYYDMAGHTHVVAAVMEQVTRHESGREKYDASEKAFKALIKAANGELSTLTFHRPAAQRQHLALDFDCFGVQVCACWRLLMSPDDASEKRDARWAKFRALGGVALLTQTLEEEKSLLGLAAELLGPNNYFETALSFAHDLWSEATNEADLKGLKKCAHQVSISSPFIQRTAR